MHFDALHGSPRMEKFLETASVCVWETERGIEKHDIMKTNEHVEYTQNHGRYENPFLKGIYRV